MKKEAVISCLAEQLPALKGMGVLSLRLFGSVARGEASKDSDVDFLVKFDSSPTYDRFIDLKQLLEEKLGVRVDLVTEGGLRPELRGAVERDAVRVA